MVHFRIEGPDLCPGFRIQREHPVVGRAVVELAVDQDWCGLECSGRNAATVCGLARVGEVAGVMDPCLFEKTNILSGYLVCCGIVGAARGSTVCWPARGGARSDLRG